ncbi:MAG: glycine cleavage system protein H [Candidatus Ranarchaeia archaeon]
MGKQDIMEHKVLKWSFKVPKGYFFNENDCWAKIEDGTARIGISDFLQTIVGDIIFVEPKSVGTYVEQFDEAAGFESVKTMLDLISPVSGEILQINNKIEKSPEIINQDPYGDGWFLSIKLSKWESDRTLLMTSEEYFSKLKEKAEKEKDKLGKSDG